MLKYAAFNGEIVKTKDIKVHFSDLGIQRGYGIFDFFGVKGGKITFKDDYFDRFYHSLEYADIPFTLSRKKLEKLVKKLIKKNKAPDSFVKLIVTGGCSSDGFTKPDEPNFFIANFPIKAISPTKYENGAHLISYEYLRPDPTVKTTNYFSSVKLQNKMKEFDAIDVLYYWNDQVSETSRSNAYMIKNDVIYTADQNILEGVTRKNLLKHLRGNYHLVEKNQHIKKFRNADEVFITSTTKAILPVVTIDGKKVGSGKVGPLTTQLMSEFNP